jgi:hypothetical protein
MKPGFWTMIGLACAVRAAASPAHGFEFIPMKPVPPHGQPWVETAAPDVRTALLWEFVSNADRAAAAEKLLTEGSLDDLVDDSAAGVAGQGASGPPPKLVGKAAVRDGAGRLGGGLVLDGGSYAEDSADFPDLIARAGGFTIDRWFRAAGEGGKPMAGRSWAGKADASHFKPGVQRQALDLSAIDKTGFALKGFDILPDTTGTVEFWFRPLDWHNFYKADFHGTGIKHTWLMTLKAADAPAHAAAAMKPLPLFQARFDYFAHSRDRREKLVATVGCLPVNGVNHAAADIEIRDAAGGLLLTTEMQPLAEGGTATFTIGKPLPFAGYPVVVRSRDASGKVLAEEKIEYVREQPEWLGNTLGRERTIPAPRTPIKVNGQSLELVGRRIDLGSNGLPAKIETLGRQLLVWRSSDKPYPSFVRVPTPAKPEPADWRKQMTTGGVNFGSCDTFGGFEMKTDPADPMQGDDFRLEPRSWEHAAAMSPQCRDKWGRCILYADASFAKPGPAFRDYDHDTHAGTGRHAWTPEFEDYVVWAVNEFLERGLIDGIYWDDVSVGNTYSLDSTAYECAGGKNGRRVGFTALAQRRTNMRLWRLFEAAGREPGIWAHMTVCHEVPLFSFCRYLANSEFTTGVESYGKWMAPSRGSRSVLVTTASWKPSSADEPVRCHDFPSRQPLRLTSWSPSRCRSQTRCSC